MHISNFHGCSSYLTEVIRISGVSVEAIEPRGKGPPEDVEARSPLVQVHSLRSNVLPIQTFRNSRLLDSRVSQINLSP